MNRRGFFRAALGALAAVPFLGVRGPAQGGVVDAAIPPQDHANRLPDCDDDMAIWDQTLADGLENEPPYEPQFIGYNTTDNWRFHRVGPDCWATTENGSVAANADWSGWRFLEREPSLYD